MALGIPTLPDLERRISDQPEARQLLNQVINDVATNSELEATRRFYGAPDSHTIVLTSDSRVRWPQRWRPQIPGYKVIFQSTETPVSDFVSDYVPGGLHLVGYARSIRPRQLAISLDKLNLDPNREFDDQIAIGLFNIGGNGGEIGVIGGCGVYYTIRRKASGWVAEFSGALDP